MNWNLGRSLGRRRPTRHTALGLLGLAGAVFGLCVAGASVASTQPPAAAAALVFDKVTVVDVESGRLVPGQRVVIVGNRITTVGDARKIGVPKGAKVVNAQGKYLIPGLWDMHTHPRRYTDFFYPLFIANGVTGIRDAWSEVPLDTLLMWRREIVAGTRVGPPRQMLPGPAFDAEPQCVSAPGFFGHACLRDVADVNRVVDSLKAVGASYIKTYQLSREMYFAVAAAARRVGLPFGGHLNAGVATAMEAADSGAWILDHINTSGDMYEQCLASSSTTEQCKQIAERLKQHNTWFVPTLIRFATESGDKSALASINFEQLQRVGLSTGSASEAILQRFYEFSGEFWNRATFHTDWLYNSINFGPKPYASTPKYLGTMVSAGMPILAGTDAGAPVVTPQPPGFSLHAELALYVAEGLTPLDALRAATLNPAKSMRATDSLGTVASGKLADLVLLDANPLSNITNTTMIRAVVANGRYYDRAELNQLLSTAQANAKLEPRPFGTSR